MNLPIALRSEAGSEPVISVDGAWGAPGLNLSHWPGNATPKALKHDLSTGIALRFSRLPRGEQEALAGDCVALCNNHYDTDGVCALFAVANPDAALPREQRLLDAARAGDFFQFPGEEAFALDATVSALCDTERSPWRARFTGLSDLERHELCTLELVERLPHLLDGGLDEFRNLWEPPLIDLRADLADVRDLPPDDLVHLSLSVWNAPAGTRSSRPAAPGCFDPGRHALFGSKSSDRHLVIGPGSGAGAGCTFRFLIGTLSWFELTGPAPPPRPDLAQLAQTLNGLEGTGPEDEVAWRHQSPSGASPELWFGTPDFPPFSEHALSVLKESSLEPTTVKTAVVEALRSVWVFPETDDDTDFDGY